jgi:hypothetical protein
MVHGVRVCVVRHLIPLYNENDCGW